MNPVPLIPESAPFTPEQRLWINGFLAGLFSNAAAPAQPVVASEPAKPLTILFGTQTGTSEGLAKKAAKEAERRGFAPKLVCMEKHETIDLTREEHVLVITSTYGDGEPPDNAQAFWSRLQSESAPKLSSVNYSVLALGDSNYPAFCQFGKNCDERFEALGARRIHPRVDCDVDYDEPAQTWLENVLSALAGSATTTSSPVSSAEQAAIGFSRKNPFPARLLTNRLLNGEGSEKEVRHFELALDESGLAYEVGDALGVYPTNCPELVNAVLNAIGCDGEEAVVAPDGGETSLRLALAQHYDITRPSPDFIAVANERGAGNSDAHLLDLLLAMNARPAATELVQLLKKLQPRLYSISSSPKAHPGEVHLTVGAVRYQHQGRERKGVCSTFLADRVDDNVRVPIFVQPSHGFKLPADPATPIIMVGPGTGVAPFRAFLEERRAVGASGRNWLFFGDQRRACDFLYREELEAWVADGHLTRLDLAFSRDQQEKIYVQHRMLEAAAELWKWLEEGAFFYVCGDASRMAKDVDAALNTVCTTGGSLSIEAAAEYVAKLKADKRYLRDVY
jgi:sulfite reductase (NADPH) flavoprotein alpha-component